MTNAMIDIHWPCLHISAAMYAGEVLGNIGETVVDLAGMLAGDIATLADSVGTLVATVCLHFLSKFYEPHPHPLSSSGIAAGTADAST